MNASEFQVDCRSEEGITIGLIDSLISIARVLSKRDLNATYQINEAIKDLLNDEDMGFILTSKLEKNRIEGVLLGLKICKEMFAQGTISHQNIVENEIYYTEELNNL